MNLSTIIIIIALVICLISNLYGLKNGNTLTNYTKVIQAITQHNINALNRGRYYEEKISYDSMKPFNIVLYRFWDWGYEHIVPEKVYEKIEPFIDREA